MSRRDRNFLKDKPMSSPMAQLAKTHFVPRDAGNKTAEKLSRYFLKICKEVGITPSYDVVYGGQPEKLRYSEFFGGIGGIQVGACDGSIIRRMYDRDYDISNNVDYSEVYDLHELRDKYILHSYDITSMSGIAILPGSNHLEGTVDKEKLNAAVLLGASIKCHPLTSPNHVKFLKQQYGDHKVIPTIYSGYNCMLQSNVVYSTGTSELGLYAMLLGKRVMNIGTGSPAGGYADAFSHTVEAPNQKDALNLLLNNPASGIFLPVAGWKASMREWLKLYLDTLNTPCAPEDIPALSRYHKYV